ILTSSRRRKVTLDDARLEKLWQASMRLEQLAAQDTVPAARRIGLCQTCSLAAFCGFD
ncbi:MAG: Dna2/Cas4 domain-containing protein, partial [Candidatus Competibacteraceae bacterium]|nr:Dna2/Cas4 domain-containing protein [Candidatus Competibacteraceae bacterium]